MKVLALYPAYLFAFFLLGVAVVAINFGEGRFFVRSSEAEIDAKEKRLKALKEQYQKAVEKGNPQQRGKAYWDLNGAYSEVIGSSMFRATWTANGSRITDVGRILIYDDEQHRLTRQQP